MSHSTPHQTKPSFIDRLIILHMMAELMLNLSLATTLNASEILSTKGSPPIAAFYYSEQALSSIATHYRKPLGSAGSSTQYQEGERLKASWAASLGRSIPPDATPEFETILGLQDKLTSAVAVLAHGGKWHILANQISVIDAGLHLLELQGLQTHYLALEINGLAEKYRTRIVPSTEHLVQQRLDDPESISIETVSSLIDDYQDLLTRMDLWIGKIIEKLEDPLIAPRLEPSAVEMTLHSARVLRIYIQAVSHLLSEHPPREPLLLDDLIHGTGKGRPWQFQENLFPMEFEVPESLPLVVGIPVLLHDALEQIIYNMLEAMKQIANDNFQINGIGIPSDRLVARGQMSTYKRMGQWFMRISYENPGIIPGATAPLFLVNYVYRAINLSKRGVGLPYTYAALGAMDINVTLKKSLRDGIPTIKADVFDIPVYEKTGEARYALAGRRQTRDIVKSVPAPTVGSQESVDPSKPKIILVDDEIPMLRLTAMVLKKEGYYVDTCVTMAEAEAALARGFYHLAILDVGVGGMQGPVLSKALRKIQPNLPIILFSGGNAPHIDEEYESFLQKPYEFEDLYNLVKKKRLQAPDSNSGSEFQRLQSRAS